MRVADAERDGAPKHQAMSGRPKRKRPPRKRAPSKAPEVKDVGGDIWVTIVAPRALDTLTDVRKEMGRIYRLTVTGKIPMQAGTRLSYMLDRLGKTITSERELEQLEAAYADAFRGLTILPPVVRRTNGELRANGEGDD